MILGNLALLQGGEPVDVDAVVSLCRMGTDPVLPGADVEHVRVWLVDSDGNNANLHYAVDQAAREVLRLRAAGKRVLLHSAAGQSRAPAVAAVYSHLATGIDPKTALSDLRGVLPYGWQLSAHSELHDAVHALVTPAADGDSSRASLPSREREAGEVRPERAAQPERQTEFLKEKWAPTRVRGLLLGLAVGDTMGKGRGRLPAEGSLRAGVSTQLACFTVDGTIRAFVRGAHKGVCHPPSVVWHAYCRWAALQGIEVERMRRRWFTPGDGEWPDGWLAQVPVLAERRGPAPATVAALSKIEQGTVENPTTTSRGCHALTRTLPLAVVHAGKGPEYGASEAREIAALTHGDPAAPAAAAHVTVLVAHCLTSTPDVQKAPSVGQPQARRALTDAIHALPDADPDLTTGELEQLTKALEQADRQPADPRRLAHLAPDATAPSALLGGLYAAASFPERDQVGSALRFAAAAPDGESVACVTGALLGAVHGAEALPVDLVSRHELAWVLDTLARDLVAQIAESPSGDGYSRGWDPHWWGRYLGW